MIAFKRILVPVDFGDPSASAVAFAVDLSKQYDADLVLVHVFDVPAAYSGMGISPLDLLAPMLEAARQQLDATLGEVRRQVPKAKAILTHDAPWHEILTAITDEHADLVVMGTHGRRGVGRALLGSVAEKIVRLSPAPVLTVRSGAAD